MEAKPFIQRENYLASNVCAGSILGQWCRRPATTAYYGQAMGTTWSVQLADSPLEMCKRSFKRMNIVNAKMSTYHPDLKSVVLTVMIQTIRYFSDTALVIQTALALHQKSLQAFDITIGPVVNVGVWFHLAKNTSEDSLEISEALLDLTSSPSTIPHWPKATRHQNRLSTIAKGYAVDAVSQALLNLAIVTSW